MTREEAIRRIKAWNLDPDDREVLAVIIPEYTESEDERIRKEIINYILYKVDGVSEEQKHSWIAYLEKQKEQKPIELGLKIPDWAYEKWDDEYMINTAIDKYSLHAVVAKHHGDTYDYNFSKSMENWLRNVVKPLILEKQKENPKSADSIPADCTSDAKYEDRWHKVEDSLPDNGR